MMKIKRFRDGGGEFTLANGSVVQGEIKFDGAATTVDLYSAKPFQTESALDIHGVLHDRTKISLLQCVTSDGPGFSKRSSEEYFFSSAFPHYIVSGDLFISSDAHSIVELSFSIDDAAKIFYDFDLFGNIYPAEAHIDSIVKAGSLRRPVQFGPNPQLFYFSGKHEIFSAETALGTISAANAITYRSPNPKGINVENSILIKIAFEIPQTVKSALSAVIDLLKFFEVLAGRPQNVLDLTVFLKGSDELKSPLDVYWCFAPSRKTEDESSEPHHADLPICAVRDSEKFATILKSWMDRHETWRVARHRLSTSLGFQREYTVDRIVGVANMFDVLPKSACPSGVVLPDALEKARSEARAAFKSLDPSPERDSILNALGRIGHPSLKRKVRERVRLITSRVGSRFPEMDLVVDQAVNCRNFFVHGTESDIDYNRNFDQVIFFIDTLEFVFAASDLVEAGWEIETWIQGGSSLSHPFGRFKVDYQSRLDELKRLL